MTSYGFFPNDIGNCNVVMFSDVSPIVVNENKLSNMEMAELLKCKISERESDDMKYHENMKQTKK